LQVPPRPPGPGLPAVAQPGRLGSRDGFGRRPDIPLLVVESRGTRKNLVECGLGKDANVSVQIMANTPDPRQLWRQTRIALLPSLWWENQPLVAIEAMINGIPADRLRPLYSEFFGSVRCPAGLPRHVLV
jgi:glycosyltransferase involved in cell wall biosynthesis